MSWKDDMVSCYYCGLPASSIDHTVSQHILSIWAATEGNIPDFVNPAEELEEFGPHLREAIESMEAHRQLLRMRIAW